MERARLIQKSRYADFPNVNCNAHMTPDLIDMYCKLDSESAALLRQVFIKFKYSARTYHKFLKLARTFADMKEAPQIHKSHLIKALMCRDIENVYANLKVVLSKVS